MIKKLSGSTSVTARFTRLPKGYWRKQDTLTRSANRLYMFIIDSLNGRSHWTYRPLSDREIRSHLSVTQSTLNRARNQLLNHDLIFIRRVRRGVNTYGFNFTLDA